MNQILHVERPRAVVNGPSLALRASGGCSIPMAMLDIASVAVFDFFVVIRAMRCVNILGIVVAVSDVEILVVAEDRRHARAEVLLVADADARPLEGGLGRPGIGIVPLAVRASG